MKQYLFIVLALSCSLFNSFADDSDLGVISFDGKTYAQCRVRSTTSEGVSIDSKNGSFTMPWEKTSWQIRSRYKKEYEEAMASRKGAEQRSNELQNLKQQYPGFEEATVLVIQVFPNGALVDRMKQGYVAPAGTSLSRLGGGGNVAAGGGYTYSPSGKKWFLEGIKDVAEDQQIEVQAYPKGTQTFTDSFNTSRTVEKWIFIKRTSK